MTRPSPPLSVPWRSPWLTGMASCTRWRTKTSVSPTRPRATIGGRLTASRRPQRPRGYTRRRERFGQIFLPAVLSRASLASCHAELGGMFPCRECSRRRRAPHCRGGCPPREPRMGLLWGSVAVPPPRGPCQGPPPARTGRRHLSGSGPSRSFSSGWLRPWARAYTLAGRTADAVPLLTQALEQPTAMEIVGHQALCRLSWGRHVCWLAAWRRRMPSPRVCWRLPVSARNAATRRMPCTSSATLRRGAILWRASPP